MKDFVVDRLNQRVERNTALILQEQLAASPTEVSVYKKNNQVLRRMVRKIYMQDKQNNRPLCC